QLARNLQPLLQGADLTVLRTPQHRPLDVPALREWATQTARKQYPDLLIAVGALRLARQYDQAAELLRLAHEQTPEWAAALRNEEAALAWHRGDGECALGLWEIQAASTPVLFNPGMAALFLGRPPPARTPLPPALP